MERGRAGKRKGVQPRSAATTSDDRALQESEAKFRSLVENTVAPIGITDLTGDFTYVNKALADLVGYTVQELVGRPFMDFLHPEDREVVLSIFMKGVPASEEAPEIEFRVKRRDGQILTLTFKPTRFEIDGKTVGFQAIITDITERKRAQDALRESQENFEAIARNAFDGVLVGAEEGVHVYANKRAAEITGYSVAELLRTTINDLVHPDESEKLSERYRRRLEGRAVPNPYETVIIRKDGRSLPIELAGARTIWQRKPADMVFFRDIEERKRMEEKIRSLARFPSENPNPVLRLDRHGVILAANEASKALLQDWGSGIGQVAPKTWRDMAADVLSSGQSRNIDIEFGGKSYTFLVNPIMEADYVNLYGRDITERKQAEEQVAYQASLLANVNDAIISSDPRFILTSWNKGAEAMYAWKAEEVLGRVGAEVLRTEFPGTERSKVTQELAGAGEFHGEVIHCRKDGSRINVEVRTVALRDREGEIIGYASVNRDITERKRMEHEIKQYSTSLEMMVFERTKKLAESERRFRELADLLPQIVFEIDEKGIVQFMNRGAFAATGLSEEDFRRGLNASDMLASAEHDRAVRGMQRIMNGEMIGEREFTVLRKDGTTFPAVVYTTRIMREGKSGGLRGIAVDISERKRMEARLAESQRLATIGETTAMVGHDLRNPLQGIVSTIYLAKRKLESPPQPSREAAVKPGLVDMLETIENEAEYMDKIVSDLQDYATPLKTETKPVEMEPLVKDTLSKIRIPQNVKVSFKVSKPLPTVMIDPAVMRRVFTNLITNAIQAMPDGGELGIDMYGTDEFLFIGFKDTGVGIPEENMGKLFNPLFTTKAKGQGLGLPVCKRLVEAHNGRITVESKPGEGSTFTVKLPIIRP